MPRPTIRLASLAQLRSITSSNLEEIRRLPHLYIASNRPGVMRVWGVADAPYEGRDWHVGDTARLYPGALVAPHYLGEAVDRDELLYNGAEPAADFGGA